MKLAEVSIATLEAELVKRKRKLEALIAKKQQLEKQLAATMTKIEQLGGKTPAAGKARGKKQPKGSSAATRHKNERTLKEVVITLLTSYKDGLSLSDLAQKVLDTGYQTSSSNFKNTLYQTLYNHERISLDKSTGCYRLISA